MHEGTCGCGIPHCESYDEGFAYAEAGLVPVLLVEDDGYLSMNAYQPTPNELFAFAHESHRVRAAAHVAIAVSARRAITSD